MPRRSCPSCQKRLPYAARRCLHCGWRHGTGGDPESRRRVWRRRRLVLAALLALGVLGGARVAYDNAPALADWYYTFAAQNLAAPFSSWGPTDTPNGAYFYCARRVTRAIDDRSVETFASLAEGSAVEVDPRRYRIRSYVDEARITGELVRHRFTCTVRYDRGRWVLEELRMELREDERSAALRSGR